MDHPLLQNTSWHFPNLKTFNQDQQTVETDCKKTKYVHANNHKIEAFRGEQT